VASANNLELVVESLPGNGNVVHVHGELDLGNVGELRQALTRAHSDGALVVDLTDCSFLDSSGLRLLLETAKTREDEGRGLVLVAPQGGVRRTLEIAGLDRMLPLHATLADAL
jgi:anti-sigma B factor antagonist